MSKHSAAHLPLSVITLLDGDNLSDKVGHTILLTSYEPREWPHIALLSVGEVLALSETTLALILYAGQGAARSLSSSKRALLLVVAGGSIYKARIAVDPVAAPQGEQSAFAYFRGAVVSVDEDEVGYAKVVSGVEYELDDPPEVFRRWRRQIDLLRQLGAQ